MTGLATSPTATQVPTAAGAPTPRRWRRRPGWQRRLITYVLLTPLALLWIYPFVWMMSASVKPNSKVFSGLGLIPTKFFFNNYVVAWTEGHIGRFFLNSVVVSVGGVTIVVITTATMGYVLGRHPFPGKRIVIGGLAALAILPQGYTIIPIFDLITKLHLDGNLFGIILAESGSAHIIQLLLYAGYFRQLPDALEESAKLDGAGVLPDVLLDLSPTGHAGHSDRDHHPVHRELEQLPAAAGPHAQPTAAADPGRRGLQLSGREPDQLLADVGRQHHQPGPGHRGVLVPAALLRGGHGRRSQAVTGTVMQSVLVWTRLSGCDDGDPVRLGVSDKRDPAGLADTPGTSSWSVPGRVARTPRRRPEYYTGGTAVGCARTPRHVRPGGDLRWSPVGRSGLRC